MCIVFCPSACVSSVPCVPCVQTNCIFGLMSNGTSVCVSEDKIIGEFVELIYPPSWSLCPADPKPTPAPEYVESGYSWIPWTLIAGM